ncbi:protein FATTY ACID EXPORT 2, chloroplastic-like [Pyrus communis]|uniref:protein FATTY ACID EXPORT 2, chloroplastic-like n=1 Tax=Pyrus communis TaxID=23211 RepID=UPI0035C25BF2
MADLCVSQSPLFLLRPKIGAFPNTAISLPLAGGGARRLQHNNNLTFHGFRASRGLSYTTSIQKLGVVSDTKSSTVFTVDSGTKDIGIEPVAGGGDGGGDFGGRGGGGGGGGGGDNSEGKGESEEGPEESKKKGMSMSQKLTLGYAVLVGVGGLMGFLKSGSQKSLLAGGISSALLFYVSTELPVRPVFASSIGLGLSAALLAVMGSRFKKSGKIFPAGVVSLVSLVMTGGYLHGILRSWH